jgi:N-acetylmuramoyl-L-alanine amidase
MDLTEVSTETTVLSSKYSRLQFRIGYCEATVNGVQVHLSLPAARWRGEPAISKTDFRLFLDPVLRYRALPQGAVRTIVIDPGHGGRDEGGRGSRIREKDLMLALGEATATALHKRGYRVHMTRTQDEGVSLDRRSQLARHYRADLFISLHANCFTSPSAKGIETFIMSPPGTSSTHSGSAVSTAYSGNAFDAHSARLAFEVQRALIQRTGADDRGVRHARFAVLKQAPCPAILVETGFLTNPEEERKLATPTYQAGIVNALVEAIVRYDRALQAER